ncbi:NAD(P)-binding protein [Imleria badia]|nr:NAD(P)-binding protein [Imleria badia]
MRAYVVKEWKHPSELSLVHNAPEPATGPEEVLVDVYSAGLNFFDILQAQGKYQVKPSFPFTLGAEFAGKIASSSQIPKGCPFKPGDRVFGSAQGAFADRIAVKWKALMPLPGNLTFDQGAGKSRYFQSANISQDYTIGLFITWPTSYEALTGRAELKPGETILVNAAAGGVGIAAVQLAKALGARVIAAAGSHSKLDICKRYGGADYVVDYTTPEWQKQVLEITEGKGVDVVYDPVGQIKGEWNRIFSCDQSLMVFLDSLKCIAFKGRALVIGFAAGHIENLPLNLVLLKNISIIGLHWGLYTYKEPSRIPVVWEELLSLFSSGKIKPVIYSTVYPLASAMDGLGALERRETWGKAVVRIRDEATAKL